MDYNITDEIIVNINVARQEVPCPAILLTADPLSPSSTGEKNDQ